MRSGGIWRLGVPAGIALAALCVVAFLSRPGESAGPCQVMSRSTLPAVPEASGLAVSRTRPGLLWTHNDSGNETDLFAFDPNGTGLGHVQVPISTRDWEDLSAAPCPPIDAARGKADECLYIGDIGDNAMSRRSIQVYRVAEPGVSDAQTGRPDVITLTYPDGSHNAEAMFVAGGRVYIVTKDRVGGLYRSTAAPGDVLSGFNRAGTNIKLQRIAQLGLTGVTDAETSPDGLSVAVRTPDEVAIYRTAELTRGRVVPTARIPVDVLGEPQGEAIALGEHGMLYLASEGGFWNPAGRLLTLRCN
jgi:hypothetical protein